MEKRKVTVTIGGQRCSFFTDDSDAYISALEQKADEVMRQTAQFSGRSALNNAVLSVVFLTDELMRKNSEKTVKTEKTEAGAVPGPARKAAVKPARQEKGQVSVWDLLEDEKQAESRPSSR